MNRAKKKSEPFPFMADKDHDMVVSIRVSKDSPANLRRLTVYYKLSKLISSFEYDVTDRKYKGDYTEFSREMYQLLLNEVKSRVVARQDFEIWFYTEADKDYVVREVLKLSKENDVWRKFGLALEEVATLVPSRSN